MTYEVLQGKYFPKNIGFVDRPRWSADDNKSAYFDLNKDTQFKVVTKSIDEIRKDYKKMRAETHADQKS